MAKKPLILADEHTPDERFLESDTYVFEEHDSSYIPGYSEVVKANDLSTSRRMTSDEKDRYYERWGTGPRRLPIQFVWLRVSNAAGGASHSAAIDRMTYTQAGFTMCRKEDFESLMDQYPDLLRGRPWEEGSAVLEADGTIRRLDSALFVALTDDPRYKAWQRRRAEEKARFEIPAEPTGPLGYSTEENRGSFEADVIER